MGSIYSSSHHSLLGILLVSFLYGSGGFLSFLYISLKLFEKARINYYRFCLFGGCFSTQTLHMFEVEYLTFMTIPKHSADVFRQIPRVTPKCSLELHCINQEIRRINLKQQKMFLLSKFYHLLLFWQS